MILTREQALEIFKRRVSVRYYDPARKISAEDFAAILDFGRLSPSSVGCEPWQFVAVQNTALREKIKPFAWGMQAEIFAKFLPPPTAETPNTGFRLFSFQISTDSTQIPP